MNRRRKKGVNESAERRERRGEDERIREREKRKRRKRGGRGRGGDVQGTEKWKFNSTTTRLLWGLSLM